LFINYHEIIIPLKQSPAANRIHLPAGRRVSTHSAQRHAAHRTGCGPALQIRPLSRAADPFLAGSSKIRLASRLESARRRKFGWRRRPLKEALQVIWGNLPQGSIDKAVKDFSNRATGCWCCSLELAVNTLNIHSDNRMLASDH